jgi:hypothetical protein
MIRSYLLLLLLATPLMAYNPAEAGPLLVQANPKAPSSQELQQIARILKQFQAIAEKTELEMDKAVKGVDLTPAQFISIAQQARNQGNPGSKPLSAQEKAQFEKVLPQVQKILKNSIDQQDAILAAEKISSQEFEQRLTLIKTDIALQEQVQKLINAPKP